MKYIILCCILAVVAAAPAPQVGAPYNPYFANPYGPYNRFGNPGAGYNPYYQNTGYFPHAHPQGHPHPQFYNQHPFQYGHYAAPAVADTRESRPDGSYHYSYATADGQQVQAEGFLKSVAPGVEVPTVTGSYSYTSPEGTPVHVNYIADEFGFRAQGPQIPNAEAIDKSVAFNIESERYHQGHIPAGPGAAPIHK